MRYRRWQAAGVSQRSSGDRADDRLVRQRRLLTREVVVAPHPVLRKALAAAPTYVPLDYQFVNLDKRWTDGAFNAYWDKIRNRMNRPRMRFYDLRHFCATYLLDLGVTPEDVAIQLGHTDGGELVRKVYGHPSESAARDRIRNTLRSAGQQNARYTESREASHDAAL